MTYRWIVIVFLLEVFAVNTTHAQGNIEVEERLDPNCGSSLMLGEIDGKPKKIQSHGVDFYIYPETIPDNYTGCQNVWLGNGHKLVTKHYKLGKVTWAKGQEPKEIQPFFCFYGDSHLNESASFNLNHCPRYSKDFD